MEPMLVVAMVIALVAVWLALKYSNESKKDQSTKDEAEK